MAGTWMLLLYFEIDGEVRPTLNEGYEYVCTCLIDANGIKNMLGADDESSATFSSCSERGRNESVKAEERKSEDDNAKQIAAAKAVKLASKNLAISNMS